MPRVAGFEHRPGEHCGSASLRDLSAFYGWGYDEPECFGLASGLGFTYLDPTAGPSRAFFGRPRWLETAFFEHLGIPVEEYDGEPFETAWERIAGVLDGGDPVMLFVDTYYLDYHDTETHFSPHSLLAVGYEDDPPDGTVHLADSEFDDLRTLEHARLAAAFTSKHLVPLQCRHLVVDDPEPERAFDEAARTALQETATYMLDPADATRGTSEDARHGIPGIRAFADDLPTWREFDDAARTARFAYQNIENRDTGGGAFRRLYAEFLETASAALPALPDDAGGRMHDIAARWTDLGTTLYAASEADGESMADLLAEAGEEAAELADREADLFADLRDALA